MKEVLPQRPRARLEWLPFYWRNNLVFPCLMNQLVWLLRPKAGAEVFIYSVAIFVTGTGTNFTTSFTTTSVIASLSIPKLSRHYARRILNHFHGIQNKILPPFLADQLHARRQTLH